MFVRGKEHQARHQRLQRSSQNKPRPLEGPLFEGTAHTTIRGSRGEVKTAAVAEFFSESRENQPSGAVDQGPNRTGEGEDRADQNRHAAGKGVPKANLRAERADGAGFPPDPAIPRLPALLGDDFRVVADHPGGVSG